MRRLSGQVARVCGRWLHRLVRLAVALVVAAAVAASALAWRLAQRPIDLDWLARRIEASVNTEIAPARLAIGTAGLAWEGFQQGVDRPLDLRLTRVVATGPDGAKRLDLPEVAVSVSFRALLLGRIVPRAIEIAHPAIAVRREPGGALALDLAGADAPGPAVAPGKAAGAAPGGTAGDAATARQDEAAAVAALLDELGRPRQNDHGAGWLGRFSQLRRLRISSAAILIDDRALGAVWRIEGATIDLTRRLQGGVEGHASLSLALGGQTARLTASAALGPEGSSQVQVRLSPVDPAALAASAPVLAPLAALAAPVEGEVTAELGPRFALRHARLQLQIASGTARLGTGAVPLGPAVLIAEGDENAITLRSLRLELPHPVGPPSVLKASGTLTRTQEQLRARIALDLDQLDFAHLAEDWPQGIGGRGARPWLTQNITAGLAHNGHVELSLEAPADLSDISLTQASGSLEGIDLTVHWLRPIPPVEHAIARLEIIDPDTIEITTQSGRQSGTALTLKDGRIRITGLAGHDQTAEIGLNIAGPIADAIALLRQPRLHLFDHHPLDLHDPGGQAAMKLSVSLPLEDKVAMDAIAIRAQGRLTDVHLGAVLAGRDLDQGQFDLDASNDGMKLSGQAMLGGLPAQLGVEMDFRSGPPGEALQKITLAARAEAARLEALGLPAGVLTGPVGLTASLVEHRDGRGEITAQADLGEAGLTLAPLGWHHPPGPASASAMVQMSHDRIVAIDPIAITGSGLDIQAAMAFAEGHPQLLRVSRAELGATRLQGEVRFPGPGSAAPIAVLVQGTSLDLSGRLTRSPTRPAAAPATAAPAGASGPAFTLNAKLDRVIIGPNRTLSALSATLADSGGVLRSALVQGRTDATATATGFRLAIEPAGDGRRLTGEAGDAGTLLAAFGILHTMQGGRLTVSGHFADTVSGRPLSGTAEIVDFSISNAPALAKLLQAMTLYGLVDALQGPGLGFSRLIAPFRLEGDTLELNDARAFNASLGLTAKGRFDLAQDSADVQGTIVPAYLFNSLLGRVPLLGRLFSPETGGGLFAASYTVHGPLADPRVAINPLSALTPGFLRGVFGIFD